MTPENCARPLIGQDPAASIESRLADVLGHTYLLARDMSLGKPVPSDVDPLVENLARRMLARVLE